MALIGSLVVGLLGAVALVALLIGVSLWRRLRQLRFVPPRSFPIEGLTPQVEADLAPGLARLAALGFQPAQALCFEVLAEAGPSPGQAQRHRGLLLQHPSVPAVAYLVQLLTPDHRRRYTVMFVSTKSDGQVLVTRNRSSAFTPPMLAHMTTQDCWLPTWAAVWQAHQDRMAVMATGAEPWVHQSIAQWQDQAALNDRMAFERAQAVGLYRTVEPGVFAFVWREALRILGRSMVTLPAALRGMQDDQAPSSDIVQPIDESIAAFERDQAAKANRSVQSKALWFIGTAALTALSFSASLNLTSVLVLLGVLLFHEMGHFMAMRWTGHKDLQVFFMPFIGAAVHGRHDSPRADQEFFVLMAGPLPGLLLGLAGLWWLAPGEGLLREAAVMAVLLNALNLLPVHPLDGGRIVELLLLRRWPWAALAGRWVGLALLLAWVLNWDGGPAKWALLVFLMLGLLAMPHQVRQTRLAQFVRTQKAADGLDRPSALALLFRGVQQLGWSARPWPDQRALVESMLPAAQQPRLPSGLRAVGLLVYVASLTLPLWVWQLRDAHTPSGVHPVARPVSDEGAVTSPAQITDAGLQALRQRMAREPNAQRRWQMLSQELPDWLGDAPEEAPAPSPVIQAVLDEADALAYSLPRPSDHHAQVFLWRAHMAREPTQRQAYLTQAMEQLQALPGADPAVLFAVIARWREWAPNDPGNEERMRLAMSLGAGHSAAAEADSLRSDRLDALWAAGGAHAVAQQLDVWQAEAGARPDCLVRLSWAQARVDLAAATQGAAAAFSTLETALQGFDAAPACPAWASTSLRIGGLWLAQSAGFSSWQRQQVQRLPIDPEPAPDRSVVALVRQWLLGVRPKPAPVNLMQLAQAHWRGQPDQARAIAQRWQAQGGRLPAIHRDDAQDLGAQRRHLVQAAQQALWLQYGLR